MSEYRQSYYGFTLGEYTLFQASGKLDLSGDRIDVWYGNNVTTVGYNDIVEVSQSWAGDDRPIFHDLGKSPQLCVEKEATNMLLNSQDFDKSPWSVGKLDLTKDAALAPDGNQTAYRLESNAFGLSRLRYFPNNLTDNEVYTISWYVKSDDVEECRIVSRRKDGDYVDAFFNIKGGFVFSVDQVAINAGISNQGNGWWRIWITFNVSQGSFTPRNELELRKDDGRADTIVGRYMYAWQSDVVQNEYPLLPIKTTSTTVTRLAQNPQITDFLQYEGGFCIWIDSVLDFNAGRHILRQPNGNFGLDRSNLFIQPDNEFVYYVFGADGPQMNVSNPFGGWENYTRKVLGILAFHDESDLHLYLAGADGEVYYYSEASQYNNTDERDIQLGHAGTNNYSARFYAVSSFTEKHSTHQRALELLAAYSEGTGINLKPSDFNPQNFTV